MGKIERTAEQWQVFLNDALKNPNILCPMDVKDMKKALSIFQMSKRSQYIGVRRWEAFVARWK